MLSRGGGFVDEEGAGAGRLRDEERASAPGLAENGKGIGEKGNRGERESRRD
jgi:hypothetical protein